MFDMTVYTVFLRSVGYQWEGAYRLAFSSVGWLLTLTCVLSVSLSYPILGYVSFKILIFSLMACKYCILSLQEILNLGT